MVQNKTITLFKEVYNETLSNTTMKKYIGIISQLEKGTLKIKSKSHYLQIKSVIKKLDHIGRNNYNFILPENYSKRSDRVKSKTAEKTINKDQLQLILSSCPNTFKGDQLRLAIQIAYYGGLRLNECLSLQKKNIKIDHDNKSILLNFIGKGNKDRMSILPYELFNSLLDDFDGFSITTGYVELAYSNIIKKKLKGKVNPTHTFHGLRHSFVKNMNNMGLSLQEMIQLTGHSSFDTLKIYLPKEDQRVSLINKMKY